MCVCVCVCMCTGCLKGLSFEIYCVFLLLPKKRFLNEK